MKNVKKDIYKSLRLNRMLVLAMLAAFVFALIVISARISTLANEITSKVAVLTETGEVKPVNWIERKHVIHIEIKDHIRTFLENFYTYQANDIERKIERALWLGDQSVEDIFIYRQNEGWINKVKSFDIKQEIFYDWKAIKVEGVKEPYTFNVPVQLVIKDKRKQNVYKFTASGKIIHVPANFPYNPHGLQIVNYKEEGKELTDKSKENE